MPVVTATQPWRASRTVITADAGCHREANLRALASVQVSALIADGEMRRRDERFASQERYAALPNPLHDKSRRASDVSPPVYTPSDFTYDAAARTCVCPAGKSLYRKGARNVATGLVGEHFRGAQRDCVPCALRTPCRRTPHTTLVRNVAIFAGRADPVARDYTAEMKRQLDTPDGRRQYGERFAAVEPVSGNLCANKRLDCFTLRGRAKVDAQWKLCCLVHNMEKLSNAGYAA